MSEDLRLIVDIVSKKNYRAEKKKGEVESNDAYTKRAKGTSAWQALQNIEFDNGEKKLFDVKPYIKGSWFGKLKNESYFKTVKVNGYNIEWLDGQDICPDDLYFNAF